MLKETNEQDQGHKSLQVPYAGNVWSGRVTVLGCYGANVIQFDAFTHTINRSCESTLPPTFDDRQAAPLDLLPEAAHQPRVDFLQQLCEVVWIRLHDLVKFSELMRAHRHSDTQ